MHPDLASVAAGVSGTRHNHNVMLAIDDLVGRNTAFLDAHDGYALLVELLLENLRSSGCGDAQIGNLAQSV